MKDLKERAIRGGVARLLNQGICFVLKLCSISVMARLLDPGDFGLVAMATVVTGIYGIFTTAGLSSATVQRESVTPEQVSTLFWINIMVGIFLCLLSLATAPVLAGFYHEPRILRVMAALGTGFVFNAAGVQHSALLQREMRFYALAVIEAFSLACSITVGIGMAFSGYGYWAIVGATLSNPAVSTLCKWKATGWVPGWPRRNSGIRSMVCFGGTLTLSGFVNYLTANVEKVLLGRFWGADVLGLYTRAYYLINVPTDNLNSTVSGVAFSALARLQNDHEQLRNYFLKGYRIVLTMTFPVAVLCAVFAEDLILVFLGPKWRGAVSIFRLLTPGVLVVGMLSPWGWLLQSIGKQQRVLKIALVTGPVVIAAYLVGLSHGPGAVALAQSVTMLLLLVPTLAWSIHGTVFTAGDVLHEVLPPLVSGGVAAVAGIVFRLLFDALLPQVPRLVLGGGLMFGVYLWVLLFGMGLKNFYLDLLMSVRGSLGKAGVGG